MGCSASPVPDPVTLPEVSTCPTQRWEWAARFCLSLELSHDRVAVLTVASMLADLEGE